MWTLEPSQLTMPWLWAQARLLTPDQPKWRSVSRLRDTIITWCPWQGWLAKDIAGIQICPKSARHGVAAGAGGSACHVRSLGFQEIKECKEILQQSCATKLCILGSLIAFILHLASLVACYKLVKIILRRLCLGSLFVVETRRML